LKTQYPARNVSLPEGIASDASSSPLSIESGISKRQNLEQVVSLKRQHLDIENMEPSPSRLLHNKRQKTAPYDYQNKNHVGINEASLFKTWLSMSPHVYPGPEQFCLLARLTELRPETVQFWFNERLRDGVRSIDFANMPTKSASVTATPDPPTSKPDLMQQRSDQTLDKMKSEASNWVREHKAKKCKRKNPKNFARDPEKPYCCTLGCGAMFKDKDDWRKHEERNYPQKGWICDLGSVVHLDTRTLCAFCGESDPKTEHNHGKALCNEKEVKARGRLHLRKQHFCQDFL
jgi:hypothetical protein